MKKSQSATNNAMAGIEGIEAIENLLYGNVEDDSDLEAELLALQETSSEHSNQEIEDSGAGQLVNLSDVLVPPDSDTAAPSHPHIVAASSLQDNTDSSNVPRMLQQQRPVSTSAASILEALEQRLQKFKLVAQLAQEQGDESKFRRMARIQKQYEEAVKKFKSKLPVDFSELPTPPGFPPLPAFQTSQQQNLLEPVDLSNVPMPPDVHSAVPSPQPDVAPPPLLDNPGSSNVSPTLQQRRPVSNGPASILEALEQRLQKYRSAAQQAQEQGDDSKFRRMSRIQKQYEEAMKNFKNKRPVNFSELPTPPGFPPFPASQTAQPQNVQISSISSASTGQLQPHVGLPQAATTSLQQSRQEQQLNFLLQRQRQFKCAALEAKKRGDLNNAKLFVRQALGFDPMIESSRCGLPVDISNVPVPPQSRTPGVALQPMVADRLKASSDLALDKTYGRSTVEGEALTRSSREATYSSLEADLISQIQLCDHNRDYFTKLGDVSKVTLFERLGTACKKELDSLRNGFRHGDPVPRFHYDTKSFPKIECCPDLGFDDLEISIVRGLLLKLPAGYEPKDADLFVKFSLAHPKDAPQSGKTHSLRGTNSPTFDFSAKLKANLKSRQLLLLIKRHGVKFEVYQKGSLFRSDKLLGTCEIKLLGLENKAELHESLDVMEGRRPVGGKLEVKVRVREPLLNKSVKEVQEKWLTIDEFLRLPKGTNAKANLPPLE